MAGRAGRRGLDKTGAAILILDNQVKEKEKVLSLLERQTKDLNSAFRPTYGMILNLLSFRDFHPEDMLRRSFLQLQKYGKSHLPSENQVIIFFKSIFISAKNIIFLNVSIFFSLIG